MKVSGNACECSVSCGFTCDFVYKLSIIDTRHVYSARRLMFFGAKTKGVKVDMSGRNACVMLIRLYKTEVACGTRSETIVSVKKNVTSLATVAHKITGEASSDISVGSERGEVKPIVSRKVTSLGSTVRSLKNPYKFFNGMVKVHSVLELSIFFESEGISTSVLKLVNKILVRFLGKASTLFSVEVDVVYIKLCVFEFDGGRTSRGQSNSVTYYTSVVSKKTFFEGSEFDVNFNFVVLKSNKRKSKSGVSVEPELKRNVESSIYNTKSWVRTDTRFTNHMSVTVIFFRGLGKFIPNFEPHTILFIDGLSTNFNLYSLYKSVTDTVNITKSGGNTTSGEGSIIQRRKSYLKVYLVNKITITRDGASYLFTEVRFTIEGLFNGFNSKVSTPTVYYFPESDLWVTSKVNVLSSVSALLPKII